MSRLATGRSTGLRQHSCLPRPPPGCFLCPLCPCPMLALPTRLGLCCPIPLSLLMLLLIVALEVYRAGVGLPGVSALNFSCVCAYVLSCSRFDFEGLESGDDGAFDKLRSWSRSIEDLQPPSALSAPFTNSLARSARQSVLRYVCSCSARLPPPAPVQVLGNSGECSCPSLHSCFQAQLSCLCLPVCLWSVLFVSLILPSDLSWVSTSPSAMPTPSGVLPRPFSGGPSIPHSRSAIPPSLSGRAVLIQLPHLHRVLQLRPSCLFPSGSALCSISCSEPSFHPACPPAHPPFTSSFRPVLSNTPRYSFVCSILRAVLPGGRCMDLMTCPSPAHLGRLSFRSCGLSLMPHSFLLSPLGFAL